MEINQGFQFMNEIIFFNIISHIIIPEYLDLNIINIQLIEIHYKAHQNPYVA